jgi:hypothetical protein
MSLIRRVLFLCGAANLAAFFAIAQTSSFPKSSSSSLLTAGKSSSNEFHLDFAGGSDSGPAQYSSSALPAEPAASGSGMSAGQAKHGWKRVASHGFAFDLGAGFNGPIGNDTSSAEGGPFITWGGNLTAGGGLRFSKYVSLLGEFQFIDDKLPGSLIAYEGGQTGNAHIVSLTANPVVELLPKRTTGVYLTGGGGYYHKSTNFNVFGGYDYYGDPVYITANSFSSNQLGGNMGFGITRRLGGTYNDSNMKLYAEARYLYIHTPPLSEANGLGTTELIPVTFGVRW